MLFHVRSFTDFAALGRLYRYLFLFSPRILALNAAYLLLCTFSASYFLFCDDYFSFLLIVFVFLLYAFAAFFRYFFTLSTHKKRIRESYHCDTIQSDYEAYPDVLLARDSTGAITRLHYDSIRYAKDRPEEILLVTKAKLVYVLCKSDFVTGRPEDFLTFLKSRYVKVKL